MKTFPRQLRAWIIIVFAVFVFIPSAQAQFGNTKNPVKWSYSVKYLEGGLADVSFHAIIEKDWHMYSQFQKPGTVLPMEFTFTPSGSYKLVGKTSEWPKPKEEYDDVFEANIKLWYEKANFTQRIMVLDKNDFTFEVKIDYQACINGACMALNELIKVPIRTSEVIGAAGVTGVTGTTGAVDTTANDTLAGTGIVGPTGDCGQTIDTAFNKEFLAGKNIIGGIEGMSLWWIFVMGLLGGLIALLTPCVWPMIPLTVSFFIKKSENKKKGRRDAIIYGISIVVIYVLLGLGITLIFGADKLNALSTNPWFNVFFFLLLLIFAISFFGAFEIRMPSKWVNAMDSRAERTSGLFSIFLMAFTLALVSFSCTGPIIGTLLVEAVSRGALAPLIGMLGFAIALAIPFTIFAFFPSWMNSLPKSGGWMNVVKVVLGFLELAFALKFLSVADLASHWGILDRETFLVLWIMIFGLMGIYLLGKLKFPHDSEVKHVSVPRLFLGMISLAFALYMVPGLWGAPLRAISAFSPPLTTQDFNLYENEVHAKYTDYNEAAAYACKNEKPILVDFTGFGCVNCRKMEASVWTDPQVSKILQDEYVLVSLWVDDKASLPENQKVHVTINGIEKSITTVGNKWSLFQEQFFHNTSQPYYILLDNNGRMLNVPRAYDEDVDAYKEWLKEGLKEYNNRR